MNGPEHYLAGERLLDLITHPTREYFKGLNDDPSALGHDIALAQVHATLALAAATAYPAIIAYTGDELSDECRGWANATAPASADAR